MGLWQRSGVGRWWPLFVALAWLVISCSSGTPGGSASGGTGQLGDLCQQSEDCSSLLCVRLTPDTGVCSTTCQTDNGCPASDNWGCLAVPDLRAQVCACRVLSESEVCGDGVDNDCNSRIDDCQVCDGKPVPADDPEHCGRCGKACRSDQRCERGTCKCPLDSPLECPSGCTNPEVDVDNCGGCGTFCGSGQSCEQGSCVCPLLGLPNFCPLAGCVDFATDSNHCGDCSTACTLGQTCAAGSCVCPAGSAPDFCAGLGCLDLQTDQQNCGECGSACVSTQTCQAGSCVCPNGQELCDGVCVDVQSDKNHCGACGEVCATALACIQGECSCSAAGYSVCGDDCAELASDPLHCGDCDTECGAGEACRAGDCSCDSALYCDGECTPVDDDQNCGACGEACPVGQTCQGGECACVGFGLTPCGDECVSLTSDELHCGTCGTECRNTEQCGVGGCACPSTQSFCENVDECVSLATDAEHCGDCFTACDPTEVCSNSACTCPSAGSVYCASQGACTDTLSNEQHCGACDAPCRRTELCNGGDCACPSGQTFCPSANACVDFKTDSLNCGSCGKACPADTHCSNSVCVCDTFGETLCGSVCYDLQTDADHCGSCTNDCGLNFGCMGGQCKCPQPTLGPEVRITTSGDNTDPVAYWDGTHVGVAFAGYIMLVYDSVRFLLLNPDGTLVPGSEVSIGQNRDHWDMTYNGSEYAVAAASYNGILFRRIGVDGLPKDAGVDVSTLNTGPSGLIRVGYSSVQGGYVVAWSGGYPASLHVRRYGADGTTLGTTQSWEESRIYTSSPMAAAPDGTLAFTFHQDDDLRMVRIDPTGTPVLPSDLLDNYHGLSQRNALLHDGSGFIGAWAKGRQILVNRGTVLNGPVVATTIVESQSLRSVRLTQTSNSVALGWAQQLNIDGSNRFRLQRFTQPDAVTGAVRPITDPVDIVSAHSTYNPQLVSTGPYRLLAVWSDGRPNDTGSHSLYARSIDLNQCP